MRIGALYPRQTNYLLSNLRFFTSGEGDKATSPFFATCYVAIEASTNALEVLTTSLLPASGIGKDAIFPMAIKFPIAMKSLFSCADGEPETPPSYTLIGAYNALL